MAKTKPVKLAKPAASKKASPVLRLPVPSEKKNRNFPRHPLEEAKVVAQKIQDEMAGKPMNRLLLAEALNLSPSSSNFRDLLSSSYKYGLTEGTEKAESILLTQAGQGCTSPDSSKRRAAFRAAALKAPVFGQFFTDYNNKKLPSAEMLPKVLNSSYGVPDVVAQECATLIGVNGRFIQAIRDIAGSPHVLLGDVSSFPDDEPIEIAEADDPETEPGKLTTELASERESANLRQEALGGGPQTPKPIFVAHGKNKAPLQQLQTLLTTFQIPHKIVTDEANLGRPISQKVRDSLQACGSAILIFTRDEQFTDKEGNEIWRSSENVVYELGATSYLYGDRIVIFKEKGIYFPTNFQNIGYIEFENNDLQARTADLLKELIGFGLVKVTPT